MFKYFEESTWQEKKKMEKEIKLLYNYLLTEESNAFDFCPTYISVEFSNISEKLLLIETLFDILHIKYECGEQFDINCEVQ